MCALRRFWLRYITGTWFTFCLLADPSRAETTVFASPSAALPKRPSNKTHAEAEQAEEAEEEEREHDEEEEEEEEEGEGASLMRARFCADCGAFTNGPFCITPFCIKTGLLLNTGRFISCSQNKYFTKTGSSDISYGKPEGKTVRVCVSIRFRLH
eukprot:COSAG06_NODE_1256_length_10087_cov_7.646676_9_plen_155_part_00